MDGHYTTSDALVSATPPRRLNKRLISEDKENERECDDRIPKVKKKKSKSKDAERHKKKSKRSKDEKTNTTTLVTTTSNAVESLVAFAHASGKEKFTIEKDMIVRLRLEDIESQDTVCSVDKPPHDQLLLATMDDGTHTLPVMILNDPRNEALQSYLNDAFARHASWISVIIKGLIATDGHNPRYDLDPIICLTTIEIMSRLSSKSSIGTLYPLRKMSADVLQSPSKSLPSSSSCSTARVRAGTIGTFLNQTIHFLTTEEFIRCHDTNVQRLLLSEPFSEDKQSHDVAQKSIASLNQHAAQVQKFLAQHSAMMTLETSQPTEHAVQNYNSALREFASSQLDRQKASLASNAGREAADRANLITQQYNAAIEEAMGAGASKQKVCLTSNRLLQWHKVLLQDLHPEAGHIRAKTVRAGNTVFCRPKDIHAELDKFCVSLTHLQERLHLGDDQSSISPAATTNAWHSILFAAVAMYGIVDIHPFADGNGRMSRIVANWALKSFPFTINLFATPAQRAEYVLALETTRHLLSLSNQKKIHGAVTANEILQVTKSTGIFAPLVRLLMDRMGRAVVEFHRVWQEKLGLAAEALECKAARQARERAKEGTCIICLDENPNIATLCCGKAVHLNCIAEWLSGKNSCPCCRSELPSISGRVVRAARHGENENFTENPGPEALVSPSSRRLRRRYSQNAQDVIESLLSIYGNNNYSTTETADDDGFSGQDTTTVEIPDDDVDDDDDDDGYDDSSDSSSSSDDDDSESEEESSDGSEEFHDSSRFRSSAIGRGSEPVEASSTVSNAEGPAELRDSTDSSSSSSLASPIGQDTTTTEEDEDMRTREPTAPRVHQYCDALYCRNRPAIDCTNNLCGRCCVLGGAFHCPRHNS